MIEPFVIWLDETIGYVGAQIFSLTVLFALGASFAFIFERLHQHAQKQLAREKAEGEKDEWEVTP